VEGAYTAALGAWRGDALALSLSWRRFLGGDTCANAT
jgi:hypothetical protein